MDEQHTGQRIGLIGDPVEHSLSPAFQQPAFDALSISVRYELWPTTLDDLPTRLADIRAGRALGANVTVPHKEAAFRLMDDVSETARRIGAVNTISVNDSRLVGDNTDVHGFTVPLRDRDFDFPTSQAVILGAGGAARAVIVALLDAGIAGLTIVNRSRHRADEIAESLQDPRVTTASLDALLDRAAGADLLVNATAIGWTDDAVPGGQDLFATVSPGAIAYDLTYRDTPFLSAARTAGLTTIDGLPMLVHQGARSFEIWTGRTAPIDLMWQSALAARAERGG
jgi:shikimate dehydrogenase